MRSICVLCAIHLFKVHFPKTKRSKLLSISRKRADALDLRYRRRGQRDVPASTTWRFLAGDKRTIGANASSAPRHKSAATRPRSALRSL